MVAQAMLAVICTVPSAGVGCSSLVQAARVRVRVAARVARVFIVFILLMCIYISINHSLIAPFRDGDLAHAHFVVSVCGLI